MAEDIDLPQIAALKRSLVQPPENKSVRRLEENKMSLNFGCQAGHGGSCL